MFRGALHTLIHTAPLFPAAVGMLAGCVLDRAFQPHPLVYLAALAAVTAAAAIRSLRESGAVFIIALSGLCAGGAMHWNVARSVPRSSVEGVAQAEGKIARLRGLVASEPQLLANPPDDLGLQPRHTERTAFLLRAEAAEGEESWVEATGLIRVTVREAVLDLQDGERVEVFGWLHALTPPVNPGSFDWRDYYRRQGVVARMNCDHRESIRRLDSAPFRRPSAVDWLRRWARGLLTDDLVVGSPEEATFLEAMILGHRSGFDRRLNEVFIRAGCIHFIAVSGTNVVILISFVWGVGRLLGVAKRRCVWVMAAAIIAYALVVEARPPALRAAIMGLLYCAALLLRRSGGHLNWTSAAAIVLCIIEPTTVFDAGFQLSFAAVLGVAYLAPALLRGGAALRRWVRQAILGDQFAEADEKLQAGAIAARRDLRATLWRWRRAGTRFLGITLAVSFGAWLAAAPIGAVYFFRIQPWGAINSMLIYPLMSAVMILGVGKVALGAASPALAGLVTWPLTCIDGILIRCVEWLAAIPGATVVVAPPPWWWVASYYLLLIAFTLCFHGRPVPVTAGGSETRSIDRSAFRLSGRACAAAAAMFVAVTAACWRSDAPANSLRATVLAVGPGAATVIELPEGQTVVFDAGSSSVTDVGRSTVVPFLRHRGIRRVDRVYVSHPNLDHFNGVCTILDEVPTGPIMINHLFKKASPPRSSGRDLLDRLDERGHPIEVLDAAPRKWSFGGAVFETLAPAEGAADDLTPNDSSTVLRISFAGRSILLTGDIEETTQRYLLERGDLHADVLVLPHHGSVRPTTRDFLQAVGAEVLVRSGGGRPERAARALSEVVGDRALYDTADVGAIEIVLGDDGVAVAIRRSGCE